MKADNFHTKGQARMFENPLLEAMTKTSPTISILVYGPCIAALLFVAISVYNISVGMTLAWFFVGFFFWTFAEYVLHRYVFHYITEANWTKRFHFLVHGAHHEYPNDLDRLLMPPAPGLLLASILFAFFAVIFWAFGAFYLTWAFFPGFFLGYLIYSFMHYAIHKYKPPKALKGLWIHHSLHHYQHPDKAFGVSNIFWDKVFGTVPPEEKK